MQAENKEDATSQCLNDDDVIVEGVHIDRYSWTSELIFDEFADEANIRFELELSPLDSSRPIIVHQYDGSAFGILRPSPYLTPSWVSESSVVFATSSAGNWPNPDILHVVTLYVTNDGSVSSTTKVVLQCPPHETIQAMANDGVLAIIISDAGGHTKENSRMVLEWNEDAEDFVSSGLCFDNNRSDPVGSFFCLMPTGEMMIVDACSDDNSGSISVISWMDVDGCSSPCIQPVPGLVRAKSQNPESLSRFVDFVSQEECGVLVEECIEHGRLIASKRGPADDYMLVPSSCLCDEVDTKANNRLLASIGMIQRKWTRRWFSDHQFAIDTMVPASNPIGVMIVCDSVRRLHQSGGYEWDDPLTMKALDEGMRVHRIIAPGSTNATSKIRTLGMVDQKLRAESVSEGILIVIRDMLERNEDLPIVLAEHSAEARTMLQALTITAAGTSSNLLSFVRSVILIAPSVQPGLLPEANQAPRPALYELDIRERSGLGERPDINWLDSHDWVSMLNQSSQHMPAPVVIFEGLNDKRVLGWEIDLLHKKLSGLCSRSFQGKPQLLKLSGLGHSLYGLVHSNEFDLILRQILNRSRS